MAQVQCCRPVAEQHTVAFSPGVIPAHGKNHPLFQPVCLSSLSQWDEANIRANQPFLSKDRNSLKNPIHVFFIKLISLRFSNSTYKELTEVSPKTEGREQKLHLQSRKQTFLQWFCCHWRASGRITQEINSLLKECKLIKQLCFDACSARSISAESVTLLVLHCSDTAATAETYSHFNCGVYSRKCKVCGAWSLREHCCNHSGFVMGLMIKDSACSKKWYTGFMCILHFSCKNAWLFMETTERSRWRSIQDMTTTSFRLDQKRKQQLRLKYGERVKFSLWSFQSSRKIAIHFRVLVHTGSFAMPKLLNLAKWNQ